MDKINPSHYKFGTFEVIDVIEAVCQHYPGMEAVLVANVIKYLSRAPLKGTKDDDLQKALWYLERLVKRRKEAMT